MELMVAMLVTLTGRTWSSFMSTSMETVEKAAVLGVCVCMCVCMCVCVVCISECMFCILSSYYSHQTGWTAIIARSVDKVAQVSFYIILSFF